jgi:S1-C subfamily serine protease
MQALDEKRYPRALGAVLLLLAAAPVACAQPERAPEPAAAAAAAPAAPPVPAAPAGAPVDRRTPVVLAVERAGPAVVSISTETLVRNPYFGGGSIFDLFAGEAERRPRERYVENSLGSGVIVDPRGYVVTNAHVLAAASRITISLLDGRQVEGEFVGSAPEYDLALVKISQPGTYPALSVDFREPLYPGETVIAIGNPFGLENTVTVGILSGTHRRVESGGENYTDFLQTDAAINPGNSGGALLTINGDLIGVNTQIDARGQNLGFAIPVARVRKVFDDLVRFGHVQQVWLGVAAEALEGDPVVAKHLAVPGGHGLLVTSVVDDSPAARAGVLAGDVVLDVDGEKVVDAEQFDTILRRLKIGEEVKLTAWREGKRMPFSVATEAFPISRGEDLLWQVLGLRVAGEREGRGLVLTEVREGSEAWRVGLRRGLLLLGMDGERLESPEDAYRGLIDRMSHDGVLLAISDGRDLYRVPLSLP